MIIKALKAKVSLQKMPVNNKKKTMGTFPKKKYDIDMFLRW